MPCKVYTSTRYLSIVDPWNRIALKNAHEEERHCPYPAGDHHDHTQSSESRDGKDSVVESKECELVHSIRQGVEYDSEVEVLRSIWISDTCMANSWVFTFNASTTSPPVLMMSATCIPKP